MDSQPKRAPWLWPLLLVVGSVMLLLHNFLLIDFDVTPYWPVLLVALGIQLLLRGDIGPSWQAHTFGITRGSVQSASIEIESGELDVQVRALHKSGRLTAGQYTARSRPALMVRNNHATLRMERGQTWWLSLADWDVGLANDLPWSVLVSSYLGQLDIDLRGVIVERAYVSTGLGNVEVACPAEAEGVIFARSTFGDVRVALPTRSRAMITVKTGLFGRARVNPEHFTEIRPGVYVTPSPAAASIEADIPDDDEIDSAQNDTDEAYDDTPYDLTIVAGTVFGSIYIV
ncbi:MAG: hypothetical protein JXA10_18560 [Anaerolineae bacterium]|nr:hypothetical protein [Anaerolineae bacterium]